MKSYTYDVIYANLYTIKTTIHAKSRFLMRKHCTRINRGPAMQFFHTHQQPIVWRGVTITVIQCYFTLMCPESNSINAKYTVRQYPENAQLTRWSDWFSFFFIVLSLSVSISVERSVCAIFAVDWYGSAFESHLLNVHFLLRRLITYDFHWYKCY